jgi:hypothetical protein
VTISFGCILHCVCFNLYCGGFILFCNVCVCVGFVMCGCVYVGFVMCVYVWVCVCFVMCVYVWVCVGFVMCVFCVGFVMCGSFGNMYTVL